MTRSILLLSLSLALSHAAEKPPIECADPLIGTAHSRWFHVTPGAMPFGMAKPGPCTDAHLGNADGWQAVGYDGRHGSIESFVSFREFQIGGIAVMASAGQLQTTPGSLDDPDSGYRSRFDKTDETASPGYYSVFLKDSGIRAELTATKRVAFHRFTFPESSDGHVIFDVGNRQGESGAVVNAFVRRTGEREIEGFVTTLPEYVRKYQTGATVSMYFVARLSSTPSACGTFRGGDKYPGETSITGPGAGMFLDFKNTGGEPVVVKMGMSYTGIANARLNLDAEAADLSFDAALEQSRNEWRGMLGRIEVGGGKEDDRIKFYTGLYHALLGRGIASDVNGAYPRNDGGTGQVPLDAGGKPEYNMYNSDSVWGTFWNLNQLWALAYPDFLSEYVRCHLAVYRDCGWLPDSIAASKFVSGVGTNFAGLLISSAYQWGIRDYDVEQAYQAVLKNETGWQNRPVGVGKSDLKVFVERGYVPLQERDSPTFGEATPEGSPFAASRTLEYSFSSHAAASFANALGKTADHELLEKQAGGWKNLFDDEDGFIRPKEHDGSFITDFEPRKPWLGFQEGNAWQYTFYVPHDPAALIERMGRDTFRERLVDVFSQAEKTEFGGGKEIDAFSGLENVYNQGNQPSLHIAWLFNYAGQPWLTQNWVRRICDTFYGTGSVHGYGYGQDEDQGQLGAWYVLAGMGLFDVQGGSSTRPSMQLSTPLFDEVRIKLDPFYHPGAEFKIQVKGSQPGARYIRSAALNGETLDQCWIPWEKIVGGGELNFETADTPNTSWGTTPPPPSISQ